jgi:pSer/pThr/pTyr-binding forkhead associated (FHA) protein
VLRRAGQPVHLTPKAFDLLELLIDRRPRAVGKSELMSVEIRVATGDTARTAQYIRTVHRFGYAFCGDARAEDVAAAALLPTARFRLVAPEGEVDLVEGDNIIGRAQDCRLCIHSSTVSRHHARIEIRGEDVSVEDLGSKNGTFVAGQRLRDKTPLFGGESIQVGSIRLRFAAFSPGTATDTFEIPPKIRELRGRDPAAEDGLLDPFATRPGGSRDQPTTSLPPLPPEAEAEARPERDHRERAGSAAPSRPPRS